MHAQQSNQDELIGLASRFLKDLSRYADSPIAKELQQLIERKIPILRPIGEVVHAIRDGAMELVEQSEKKLELSSLDLVYGNLADHMATDLSLAIDEAYSLVLTLQEEPLAKELLARRGISGRQLGSDLIARARANTLSIKQSYRRLSTAEAEATTEIYYLREGKPSRKVYTNALEFEDLPADVQEQFIKGSDDLLAFTVFPLKG